MLLVRSHFYDSTVQFRAWSFHTEKKLCVAEHVKLMAG